MLKSQILLIRFIWLFLQQIDKLSSNFDVIFVLEKLL